ncbi:MAG: fused MFS/spermidine synthase [Planctomycetota bacterium]
MDQPIITKSDLELQNQRAARWSLIGCSALVFTTSVCIMVLELTASRLIAKAVGSSLYTWTSVIGVILAGISIGNFLGGWVADRYDHRRSLAWLFFISSFCCITIYPLSQLMSTRGRPEWISWQIWVVLVVSSLFLHPSVALGMISPITASMALAKARHTGSTVGNVYAWGAMGSIFGTFLAGFYLISWFGTQHIIWMTAATLALLGVIVASGQKMFRGAMLFGWLQLVLWIGLLASVKQPEAQAEDRVWLRDILSQAHELGLKLKLRSDDPDEYNAESDYFYINVANRHEGGDTVKALHLDHLTHSYFNPLKPTELYYDYEDVYAAVTERAAETWNRETAISLTTEPDQGWQLPTWAKYDPATKKISVHGAINSKKRDVLLTACPSGEYWKAIEELTSDQNMALMSSLSSVALEKLPEDMVIPETLGKKVRHDETLGTLIRYEAVTPEEREALLELAPHKEYRRAVEDLFGQSRQVSTMFLGGGGFVFPRWIEANFPRQPLIHVLELDPAVKLAVQREMGLPDDDKTFVKTLLGDARNSVDDLLNGMARPAGSTSKHNTYDFIYGDAFNDFSVPWHLTTKEFDEKIKTLLTPAEGVFLVNIIDIYPRAEAPVQTLRGFAEVTGIQGPLPAAIWPVGRTKGKWHTVPNPSEFGKVEIFAENNGHFKFRCQEAMTDEFYDVWTKLLDESPPVEIAAEDPKTAKASATAELLTPLDAIASLSDLSNSTPVYTGELPAAMMPDAVEKNRWVLGRAPYDFLEIKLRDTPHGIKLPTSKSQSFLLGLRGVMSPAREQELQKLAGSDVTLQKLFQELSRQSRDSKPGRFLGAYANTVCQVFPNVYVFSANEGLPTASRDTFVVACSLKKLNFNDLKRSGGYWGTPPFAAMETTSGGERVFSSQMTSILELARGMTLTDDYAPVDNLLIPVFADQ